ncbi:hypothetical protein D3C71_2191960 [compost metagenome]
MAAIFAFEVGDAGFKPLGLVPGASGIALPFVERGERRMCPVPIPIALDGGGLNSAVGDEGAVVLPCNAPECG